MKRILTIFLLTFHFSLFTIHCPAQLKGQKRIDSLENALKKFDAEKKELGTHVPKLFDSTEAKIYIELGRIYINNNPDKTIDYAQQSLTISDRIGFKKGMSRAYSLIGATISAKGYLDSSLYYYDKELKIEEETGDKAGLGSNYIGRGNVYSTKGDYPEALKNYFEALKFTKEAGDVRGTSISYINIAAIYVSQENYSEALKILNERLDEFKKINFKQGISVFEGNIAEVYSDMGNYQEALKSNKAALIIYIETDQKRNIAVGYHNIAENYKKLKEYDSALAYYQMGYAVAEKENFKDFMAGTTVGIGNVYLEQLRFDDALKNYLSALKIYEELQSKQNICHCYVELGVAYFKQKNFKQAASYYSKAMAIANEAGMNERLENIYSKLTEVDSATGDFRAAFNHRGLYMMIKDSISNNDKSKKINTLTMNYEFDKKEKEIALLKSQQEVDRLNKSRTLGIIFGMGGALLGMISVAFVFYQQRNKISKEKKISESERKRSDELLLNILPAEVANELKQKGVSEARDYEEATVMFTDFKNFTAISEKMTPSELVKEIDTCFSAFDNIIHKHGIEKIKTIGDAYMCAGGLPVANRTHAEDTVNAALEIRDFMANHNKEKLAKGELPFEIRVGINTGPVVAGIVGVKKFAYDIWGDTVNLASRMESSGKEGEVNISGSTYELVKDKFTCTHRGKIQTKNKGEVDMYFVS